nr:hypothetical protein [Methylobacterium sp. ZNC0032]
MSEFIPKGFTGLPQAIWFMSTQIHPELWQKEALYEREMPVWVNRIMRDNDAVWLEDHLRYPFFAANEPFPERTSLRISSYYGAESMLRVALHAGDLTAYFISAAKETYGKRLPVLADGWGTDAGQEILWCGRANLDGEPPQRMVFVDVYSLRQHFFEGPKAKRVENPSRPIATAPMRRRGRPPEYDWAGARQLVLSHFAYHGLPSPDDPDIPTQAAVERLVADHVSTADRSPATSTVREYVVAWQAEFATGARPDSSAGK